MSTFVNNDVSSGEIIYASDHNTQGALVAAVLNGGIDNDNINASAAIDGSKLANSTVGATKVNFGGSGAGIWWEEIARTTLDVAGDTITVNNIPLRKYLYVKYSTIPTGGTTNNYFRLNNDSGANYAERIYDDGVSTTTVSQDKALLAGQTVAQSCTGHIEMLNIAGQEKVGRVTGNRPGAPGAANAPVGFRTTAFKWANTTNAVSRIDVINVGGTGDFAIGSEVVVLGHD